MSFIIENGALKKYIGSDYYFKIENGIPKKYEYSSKEVVIPEGVTSIGEKAFSWCKSLTSVIIPEGVASIGDYAFRGCNNLKSVVIPDSVTSIGDYAFSECWRLVSVDIPKSVTSIGDYAFSVCSDLMSVIIPDGVTRIGTAFSWCRSLKSVVIPESVTSIGDYAFSGCESLTSIVIPEGVTYIGKEVFDGCINLTRVIIPKGVKSIGDNAFKNCGKLQMISAGIIPSWETAPGCSFGLRLIQDKVRFLAFSSKSDRDNLTDYEAEGKWTKYDLELLNNGPEYRYRLPARLLGMIGRLMDPAEQNDENKALMIEFLTKNAKKLLALAEEMEEPAVVSAMFENGIINSGNQKALLKLISASENPKIAALASTEVQTAPVQKPAPRKLPVKDGQKKEFRNVEMITEEAETNHAACDERDLTAWNTIFSLSERAYGWRLERYKGKQKLVYIPDMINGSKVVLCLRIGELEECGVICNKRLWAQLPRENKIYSAIEYLKRPEVFPEEYSGHVRFFIRNKENRIELIKQMSKNDDAEAFTAYLNFAGKSLTIQDVNALMEVSKEAVSILAVLVNWKNTNFKPKRLEKLEKIQEEKVFGIRPPTVADYKKLWTWSKLGDGSLRLGKYKGSESVPVIPVKIGKSHVTVLGKGVFAGNSALTEIVIPDCIVAIEADAFQGCKNLAKITLPDSVTCADSRAFQGCKGLADSKGYVIVNRILYDYYGWGREVVIPDGVTAIGDSAFEDRKSLTRVTIPDSVISVGNRAFLGCRGLADGDGFVIIHKHLYDYYGSGSDISIPDGVTSIGDKAFEYCSNLTSITIPDSVTRIGESAFEYCSNLTSITIPGGVTHIGDRAFNDCSNLTSIAIPDGVTRIGGYTFSFCYKLASIMIPSSVTSIGGWAFDHCSVTIHAPAGSYAEQYAKERKIPFVAV